MFKTLPAREDQERIVPSPPHSPFRARFEEEAEEVIMELSTHLSVEALAALRAERPGQGD